MANAIIGAELRLEGEKDFKRAVSSINTDLKVLGSELKKTESEYKGNENSLSALTAKSEKYSQIAEEQRKKRAARNTQPPGRMWKSTGKSFPVRNRSLTD